MTDYQEYQDKYYMKHGKCCAGCDYWESPNTVAGICKMSKIVPAAERASMLGISGISKNMGSGHAITKREYVCGNFKDSFDWNTLPITYLKKIGYDNAKHNHVQQG